jgi:hypothetical protein
MILIRFFGCAGSFGEKKRVESREQEEGNQVIRGEEEEQVSRLLRGSVHGLEKSGITLLP